ncbi:ImmA/IrrE family metallo-endopeptidase [Pseudidiomarina sp. 1ASP75-14]|uniref:helix-turn-helix domain-containing protein n=1 Tax=Pseudidiomarina terrestris TaxID=2820060 RepID=UPI0026561AF1|nr:XRE family transcriptional regulator [Pseudidiomarina sp. 1ASP75-14]MDN7136768.1 ImmA/IrrE family metallo-endopeptidase [Pseudidiomarina sp. 1ASP75-14]
MERQTEQQHLIAQRITYFRKRLGLKQQALSELMEFNQRQTLSDIERGERLVKPDELTRFAQALQVQPMAFLDAFEPAIDVEFSWRTDNEGAAFVDFEERGRRILNLMTTLRRKLNITPVAISSLPLGERNSYEDAQNAAEKIGAEFKLGDRPGQVLHKLFDAMHVDCIYLDLPAHISGAAMVSDEALLAVINANQVRGRRNFDKAHELFHCLTWRTMKPNHIDRVQMNAGGKRSRIEQLADAFAGALLMPAQELLAVLPEALSIESLMPVANDFEVSVEALVWRLVALERLTTTEAKRMLEQDRAPGNGDTENLKPHKLLSESYLSVLSEGIQHGLISVRRVASILGISIDALRCAFEQHDMAVPFDI